MVQSLLPTEASGISGLSGRTRFDLVVNLPAAKALADGEITVAGGDQWRPFVRVDDAATAILKALAAPLEVMQGEVFNRSRRRAPGRRGARAGSGRVSLALTAPG
ncbi:MAG: NAD-dependent epimerase/dehydratase family protein [Chloroflexi bacterium]|nr:NAD-dependent epimerase/dehydratase family protein [Chloroflexota bacterium]